MNQQLVQQKESPIVFRQKPEEWLTRWAMLLETMQQAYRMELSEEELILWRETLKSFSIQEIEAASKELILNPPKQELHDGTIQVWRGMPKLPDVIQVIYELRQKQAAEAERHRSQKFQEEMRDLQRRKDAGEKFYGMEDLVRDFNLKNPAKKFDDLMKMPEPELVESAEEEIERLRKRRAQMLEDLYRAKPELRGTIHFKDEENQCQKSSD